VCGLAPVRCLLSSPPSLLLFLVVVLCRLGAVAFRLTSKAEALRGADDASPVRGPGEDDVQEATLQAQLRVREREQKALGELELEAVRPRRPWRELRRCGVGEAAVSVPR